MAQASNRRLVTEAALEVTRESVIQQVANDSVDPESDIGASLYAAIGAQVDPAIGRLSTPQAPRLSPIATIGGRPPRLISLITGSNDEVLAPFNCTVSVDTVNTRHGARAWKMTNNGAAGVSVMRVGLNNPNQSGTGPLLDVPAWQGMVLECFIPDPTKYINLTVSIYGSADLAASNRWQWNANTTPVTTLVAGRNFIRVPASFASVLPKGRIDRVEVQAALAPAAVGVAGDSITIMGLHLEAPPKARFVLTEDRGYKTFYDHIYPQMRERGWPVVFAVDCTRFGDNVGTVGEAMTLAQMKACAVENGNEISFHGWDGAPTASMTADQLRADTVKSIKFLQHHFPDQVVGRFIRAAYVQNDAAQWAEMRPYLLAAASATTDTLGPTLWPPNDLHKIRRWSLDNYKLLSNITDLFTQAKATHLTYNVFLHGYHTAEPGFDVNEARWSLFRDLLDDAIEEDWAEVVTFEQLLLEAGVTFRTSGGATVAEYADAQGARVTKTLL